jgi:hypothetical protein
MIRKLISLVAMAVVVAYGVGAGRRNGPDSLCGA